MEPVAGAVGRLSTGRQFTTTRGSQVSQERGMLGRGASKGDPSLGFSKVLPEVRCTESSISWFVFPPVLCSGLVLSSHMCSVRTALKPHLRDSTDCKSVVKFGSGSSTVTVHQSSDLQNFY